MLLLLKSLAEDLSVDFSDTLPTGRKTQVIQELNKNYLVQVFSFFVQLFALKHSDYIDSKKNNDVLYLVFVLFLQVNFFCRLQNIISVKYCSMLC